MAKLEPVKKSLEDNLDHYQFAEAYEQLYHFVWDDLADWYIEAGKTAPNVPLLSKVLEVVLILMHPFAPFVTETIWQTLKGAGDSVLAGQLWPEVPKADEKKAKAFSDIQPIVTESRFITKTLGVANATLYYTDIPFLAENAQLIKRLAHLNDVSEVRDGTGVYLTSTPYRCWLDIDLSVAGQFVKQLATKLTAQQEVVKHLEKRLNDKDYTSKAPDRIVNQTKEQLDEARSQLKAIEQEYQRFQST